MKKLIIALAACAAFLAPSVTSPALSDTPMSMSTVGAGPGGYDWQIGTWSCINPAPSAASGPAHQTETISKTSGGAILIHTTGTDFDFSDYDVYVPTKKMWVSPVSGADGTYGSESTSQTGKKIVWAGSAYFPDSGKTMPTRDTVVNSPNKYTDLGEFNSGGAWKELYNITCTRT